VQQLETIRARAWDHPGFELGFPGTVAGFLLELSGNELALAATNSHCRDSARPFGAGWQENGRFPGVAEIRAWLSVAAPAVDVAQG